MQQQKTPPITTAIIESLSHEGRGIAHVNNKITFIENALPGEEVKFIYTKRHSRFDTGTAVEILKPSSKRTTPYCKHYDICGGCVLQHLNHQHQLLFKTKILQEQLKHIAGLDVTNFLPPIIGPNVSYRGKARLAVKYVQKKGKVLVGFHEKNSSHVVATEECEILNPRVGKKIHLLSKLITELSIYQHIPQIEIACGNEVTALVLRNLQKFSDTDIELINKFAKEHQFQIYTQSGGIDSVTLINPEPQEKEIYYNLPNHNIKIFFAPNDFTQINYKINIQLVDYVLKLLEIEPIDKVLDFFCGIGNFTLPIATKCEKVIGIEGNKSAVIRAEQNAEYNKIKNAKFYVADLAKELSQATWDGQQYDKILLDPPRTGAEELCRQIKKFGAKKIVYVSCNPATFARDAKIIVEHGYELQNITLADMYPHTSHAEVIGSFNR
jgi:23S rRNA (uracil1939-C5)-methyltransferase